MTETPGPVDQAKASIGAALNSPLPRFYANSFVIAASEGDVMVILQCNGQNIGICNINYIAAKSLAASIGNAVESYEKRSNSTVPVLEVATETVPERKK